MIFSLRSNLFMKLIFCLWYNILRAIKMPNEATHEGYWLKNYHKKLKIIAVISTIYHPFFFSNGRSGFLRLFKLWLTVSIQINNNANLLCYITNNPSTIHHVNFQSKIKKFVLEKMRFFKCVNFAAPPCNVAVTCV